MDNSHFRDFGDLFFPQAQRYLVSGGAFEDSFDDVSGS
jgi:hypothetical protein